MRRPRRCHAEYVPDRAGFNPSRRHRMYDERGHATKAGITDFERVYTRDDMVTNDVTFAATDGSVRRMIYRNPVK